MYWFSNVPPYTQYSLIQSQIWFRSGRARFSVFTIYPFPYNVVVCNPLFIPSYHPVQKGLDFVPSKQEMCIWQLDHPNFSDLIHVAPILNISTSNPIFRIWSEMVCWAELSLSAISDVIRKGSCFNIALTTSSSIKDGRPKRGLSERSKSPVSNFSYHLLCPIRNCTYTYILG